MTVHQVPSRDDGDITPPSDAIAIDFSDGFHATVDALHIRQTYLGFLEGQPQLRFNQMVLSRAAEEIERMWGKRRTYVIPPLTTWSDAEHEWLPRWQVFVWLQCARPVQLEFGASELAIVFFRHQISASSLRLTLQEQLGSLRWGDYAQDYESD